MQDPYGEYPQQENLWTSENHGPQPVMEEPDQLLPEEGDGLSPEEEEAERAVDRKKLWHGISIVAGLALIVVCGVLIAGLVGWLKQDITAQVVLL